MNNTEKTKESVYPRSCVDCGVINCSKRNSEYPEFCLTTALTDEEIDEILKLYKQRANNKVAIASAEVEGGFYGKYTRVEETMEFAHRIGAKKIGIATCAGLIEEARIFARILRLNGFEVYGAACKVGSLPKTGIGVAPEYTCVVKSKVDLYFVIGLCCGHDSLFYKYAKGYTTTLIVKDRVLGNNPVQALYQARAYYRRLLTEPIIPQEGKEA